MLWDKFIELEGYMSTMMEGFCGFPTNPRQQDHPSHTNKFYRSDKVDLAHISVIDMREEKKMWMMHVACYAKPNYPMPIFGFDVIVGKNKVTGCFHDMSPTVKHLLDSTAESEFKKTVGPFVPKRERELPQWAKEIFSDNMVVAGATNEPREIENLCHMGRENMFSWFSEIEVREPVYMPNIVQTYNAALTKYCDNQLKNTNSKNVMISLGLEEDYVTRFKRIQFPY
tara:strand:+ start:18187 stop:18867 length:681 start_codon:yes stop_codon:yes gene_type:complete